MRAGADGVAHVRISDAVLTLDVGPAGAMGRSLVVHAAADDMGRGLHSEPWPSTAQGRTSKTTGNSGPPVAWGVIGRSAAA